MSTKCIQGVSLWLLRLCILIVMIANGWFLMTHLQEGLYLPAALNLIGVATTSMAVYLSFRLLGSGS